jgi:hypothetical protein
MNFFIKFQQKKKQILTTLVFSIILITGITIFRDYNAYSDEPFHYWAGSVYYKFIKTYLITLNLHNSFFYEIQTYLNNDGYKWWFVYPIFFDLLSEFLVDLLNLNNQNIFFLRHFLVFFIFFISTIFFYFLIEKRFNNYYFSILSVLILFLTPCIFSNSFYNSKDIIFLSFSIISIYYAVKFIENNNIKNLIFFSIFSGLMINARIFGLLLVLSFYFVYLFHGKIELKSFLKKIFFIFFSFFIILAVCFLFWPFLWFDFLNNIQVYKNYITTDLVEVNITNLYFGKIYQDSNLPLHFLPVWILITTPISVLLLSIIGYYKIFISFLNNLDVIEKTNQLYKNKKELLDFFIFIFFSSSFLFGLFSNYMHGSWRYFYFIYPMIIYFGIYSLNLIKEKNIKIFYICLVFIIFNLFTNVIWMTKNHPFQNVFFNSIQKKLIKKNFELDYWGNSDVYMLKYILKYNDKNNIKVSSTGYSWIKGSFEILSSAEKSRLIATDVYKSDFVIVRNSPPYSNLKLETYIKKNFNKYFELIIDGNIINSIYKRN